MNKLLSRIQFEKLAVLLGIMTLGAFASHKSYSPEDIKDLETQNMKKAMSQQIVDQTNQSLQQIETELNLTDTLTSETYYIAFKPDFETAAAQGHEMTESELQTNRNRRTLGEVFAAATLLSLGLAYRERRMNKTPPSPQPKA